VRTRSIIAAASRRTASTLSMFSATPPTSDLCAISGDTIFSTARCPASIHGVAASAAASASAAITIGRLGMP
jgi:hypothetical protein